MKIILDIDETFDETIIKIQCKAVDDSIQRLIDFIKTSETEFIVGRKGEVHHILNPDQIYYFRTKDDGVVAITEKGEFHIKEKLYELEDLLPNNKFVRLSKSVIANLYELSKFEASFNGTLCVYFKSGEKEYVSRHYVPVIKQALKMNRRKER